MKFNINFVRATEPAETSSILTEARARVIWGEASSSVRDYLISNGISETEAESIIQKYCAERNTEIRKIGIRNVVIGSVLMCGGGAAVCLFLKLGYSSGLASCAAASMVGVLYGIWKVYSGIIYLARPQSEHTSISDIPE